MFFSIAVTILALGIMVCMHELAHMLTAKKFGILCHEFSIGMGPKLFSWGKGETKYRLRLLPIGGFVQMEGEGEESSDPRAFGNQAWWKRLIVLAAGAISNIAFGWILFCIIAASWGIVPSTVESVPEAYKETSAFCQGDEILKIGKTRVHSQNDILMSLSMSEDDEVDVTVRRNGEKIVFPASVHETGSGRVLGVYLKSVKNPTLIQSLQYGAYDSVYIVKAVFWAVRDLVLGRQSIDSLSGPVEMVAVVDGVMQSQPVNPQNDFRLMILLNLFAMISVNIGVFNLLPIPALDGGQILFTVAEKISGKKIKPEITGAVNFVFLVLLMLLALAVTCGDIIGLVK